MSYKQLSGVNLSIIGVAYYCLAYTESVFGSPHLYPSAWAAYRATKYKHTGNPPASNNVPLWFSWTGAVNGVVKNWGHAAVWVHGKIYSSPIRGTGHLVYNSIGAIEKSLGVKYVGWSEDIAGKRIVRPETVAPSPPAYYTVQEGDTMSSIAMKFHMTLDKLEVLNPISTLWSRNYNLIYKGERIRVK